MVKFREAKVIKKKDLLTLFKEKYFDEGISTVVNTTELFVSRITKCGHKQTAAKLFAETMTRLKEQGYLRPLREIEKAVNVLKLGVTIYPRKLGRKTHIVPRLIR